MNSDKDDDIKKAVQELRRDVRSILVWVRFLGIVLIIQLVIALGPLVDKLGRLAPALGVVLAILVAGFTVSHFSAKKPEENEDTKQAPAPNPADR